MRPLPFALLLLALSANACSARGSSGGGGNSEPDDAATATDSDPMTVDAPNATPDAVETPDVPSRADTPTSPDAPVTPDAPPPVDVVAPPDVPATPDVPTTPDVPSTPDVPTTGGGYTRTTTTATLVEACTLPGVQRILVSADDESATVTAPFNMTFFGLPVPAGQSLYVSSNGFVSFQSFDATMTFAGTIPSTAAPNGVVAAYWADLVLGTSGVCVATVGSAPARRYIVQWKNGQFYSGDMSAPTAGTASFEVIYNESDRSVDFLYETISGQPEGAPTRAAVGLESGDGTRGLAICAGGRIDATPPATDCTAVTTGTRFRLVPST